MAKDREMDIFSVSPNLSLLLTRGNELAPLAFNGRQTASCSLHTSIVSWPQKLCEGTNNASTLLVFTFQLFCPNVLLFLSSLLLLHMQTPLFSCPPCHIVHFSTHPIFLNFQTMLTCDILFHPPSRSQPVPRRMQRASANLSLTDGHS